MCSTKLIFKIVCITINKFVEIKKCLRDGVTENGHGFLGTSTAVQSSALVGIAKI